MKIKSFITQSNLRQKKYDLMHQNSILCFNKFNSRPSRQILCFAVVSNRISYDPVSHIRTPKFDQKTNTEFSPAQRAEISHPSVFYFIYTHVNHKQKAQAQQRWLKTSEQFPRIFLAEELLFSSLSLSPFLCGNIERKLFSSLERGVKELFIAFQGK